MNPAVAFELTPEHDLATYGGTTHLRDGLHLSIHDALAEGDGTIVTDDPLVIHVLEERQDLRKIPVPAGALITSHQLQPTRAGQHQREHGIPEIAEPAAVDLTRQHVERAAAQMRGDIPFDTPEPAAAVDPGPPAGPDKPDTAPKSDTAARQDSAASPSAAPAAPTKP